MVLAAFTGQLLHCWRHFLCYVSQDFLFNIQSKLGLVEIGSKYRLIWITEKTAKYSCAGAWNSMRDNAPRLNGGDHLVSQSNFKACLCRLARGSQ